MGVVEFYFLGLISHVGPDNLSSSHGVIVLGKNHQHDASVHFSDGKDANGGAVTDVGIDIGYDIDIGQLPTAPVSRSSDFRAFVPSLARLCTPGTNLTNGVKHKTSHADAKAFIGYPAGDFEIDVADRYLDGATYVRPDFHLEQCVARLTVIQVTTPDRVLVTIHNNPYYAERNSWVLILNVAPDKNADHFDEYKHITDAMLLARVSKNGMSCGWENDDLMYLAAVQNYIASQHFDAATEIECSNSQFP